MYCARNPIALNSIHRLSTTTFSTWKKNMPTGSRWIFFETKDNEHDTKMTVQMRERDTKTIYQIKLIQRQFVLINSIFMCCCFKPWAFCMQKLFPLKVLPNEKSACKLNQRIPFLLLKLMQFVNWLEGFCFRFTYKKISTNVEDKCKKPRYAVFGWANTKVSTMMEHSFALWSQWSEYK